MKEYIDAVIREMRADLLSRTQLAIALDAGINVTRFHRLVSGTHEMKLSEILKLADYYKVRIPPEVTIEMAEEMVAAHWGLIRTALQWRLTSPAGMSAG